MPRRRQRAPRVSQENVPLPMDPSGMECPVCFHEFFKFKLLNCGHFFCEKCVEDLAKGRFVVADCSSTKSARSAVESSPKTGSQVECPTCRQITQLPENRTSNTLRSKFIGNLRCYQCDSDKPLSEFRWCVECVISVCSACYVDRHFERSPDGAVRLHTATKWEQYHAVQFCLSQIKFEAKNTENMAMKAKDYIGSYLDGLKEFLNHDLDQRTRNYSDELVEKSKFLAEAFGLRWEEIRPAESQNLTYQYVLPDLKKFSGLEDCVTRLQKVEGGCQFRVRSIPYPELARHLLGVGKKPFEPKLLDQRVFQEKCKESMVLGGNWIKKPSDICLIDSETLAITDFDSGIFLFQNHSGLLQGPLPLKQGYHNYTRITRLPDAQVRIPGKTCFIVNVNAGTWGFLCIALKNIDRATEHVTFNGARHWSLPSNENLCVAASAHALFAVSSRHLWKLVDFSVENEKGPKWSDVYSVVHSTPPQYKRMGPVLEKNQCSDVFLINTAWKAIDIISVGHDNSLWGVKRVEFPENLDSPVLDPILAPLDDHNHEMLFADRKQTSLFWWNLQNSSSCMRLCKFGAKTPQKLVYSRTERVLYLISEHKDHSNLRCLDVIRI